MNYSLVNKQGRFLAVSYSSYGGRMADFCNGEWTKQPRRWQTHAGAEAYRNERDWLKDYVAVPTPLTRQEQHVLLKEHGVEMVTTLGDAVQRIKDWSQHLPDALRAEADAFASKMNNLVLRATGGVL